MSPFYFWVKTTDDTCSFREDRVDIFLFVVVLNRYIIVSIVL